MPLFKVESANKARIIIKAESIQEIIEKGIEKLKLSENIDYKLVQSSDGTEINDDEVLLEFALITPEPLILSLVNPDNENNQNAALVIPNNENNQNVANNDVPSTSEIKDSPQAMNLEIGVWSKISDDIKAKCIEKKELDTDEKKKVCQVIVDYMLNTLKTTKRSIAVTIAKDVCNKYPKSFIDKISYNESWGSGYETFFLQIYNAALYKNKINLSKQSGQKRSLELNSDSDDEDESRRKKENELKRKQDEYGCVNYAPLLADEETSETQEILRLRLVELFLSDNTNKEIGTIMNKTYATLRAIINDSNMELKLVAEKWPFFLIPNHFISHSSYLLGKDVQSMWTDSIEGRMKIVRRYFAGFNVKKEKKSIIDDIIKEAKLACSVRKDKMAKHVASFKLLIQHFKEDEKYMFRIKQQADEDNGTEAVVYPVIIIEGSSLYDQESVCSVHVNSDFIIKCADLMEAILINFLSYYVFGFTYHPQIVKTLEFIQRIYLRINPPVKIGKSNKKRKLTPYDSAVYSLAKKLSKFSDDFAITEDQNA